jgi:formylmethanofuran dehydrogenase subunit E
MTRILILIILGWILYQIIKRMAASGDSKPNTKPVEKFVLCAKCGCHVPEAESQIKNDQVICNNPDCQK